jgi:hypothetical protein
VFLSALAAVFVTSSFAGQFELYPYAGGTFWGDVRLHPDQVDKFSIANPGVFGVRGAYFVTQNLQLGGNLSYQNQFTISQPFNPSLHSWLYDFDLNYNFRGVGRIYPYVTGGAGAMRLSVEDADQALYTVVVPPFSSGGPIPFTSRVVAIDDGDTFFNISYGGGVKGERLWGPVGFRFEIRGRTAPNFFGDTLNAWEPTGGLLFTWGER